MAIWFEHGACVPFFFGIYTGIPVTAAGIITVRQEDRKIISYQRDRFVPTSELSFPYWDDVSGTIRGYRVFTACRTLRGKIFRLDDHLDRLYRSAAGIFMTPPVPMEELRAVLDETLDRNRRINPNGELLLNIVFSGGLEGSTMKKSSGASHLYVAVQPLVAPPPAYYEKGVALATFYHQRFYPDLKLLNYVAAIVAHQTVIPAHDAYEVLFVCPVDRQTVLEGSTYTMFFVDAEGAILTPPLDGRILDSITRRALVEILIQAYPSRFREVPVSVEQIPSFSESFLVSTTRDVLPVVRIDDTVIGEGVPGPVTWRVMELFREYLASYV